MTLINCLIKLKRERESKVNSEGLGRSFKRSSRIKFQEVLKPQVSGLLNLRKPFSILKSQVSYFQETFIKIINSVKKAKLSNQKSKLGTSSLEIQVTNH